jgi:hypothetical protein
MSVEDNAVLVDLHAPHQRGWLVIAKKAPHVRKIWRELPKEKVDCAFVARHFGKVLDELQVGGVQIDARQCGRHDAPWWAASQGTGERPLNVTVVSVERVRATRESMVFPALAGKRWAARVSGKALDIYRDAAPLAHLPTGLTPTPNGGWIVVSPGADLIVACDPGDERLQGWIRDGTRWLSFVVADLRDR